MTKEIFEKILATAAIAVGICTAAAAQPRSVGVRTGGTGTDVTYQHTIVKKDFIEVNAGVDYGCAASKSAGFKASCLYNFTIARPAWTDKGTWCMYAGPGLAFGYVQDPTTHEIIANTKMKVFQHGFLAAIAGQVGLEYTFWFPLQLSVDLRPYIGIHCTTKEVDSVVGGQPVVTYENRTGFYNNGLLGFVPSISVKYKF
ncbi:MAG: hypothetical protein ACI4TM_10305 [Candidatus Cryptobacteroides sp.]